MIDCPPHILVMDDDPQLRYMASCCLTLKGYQLSLVDSGTAALSLVNNCPPEVILLDIGLPDIPGTELFADIRAQCPNAAVIFITALNEGELAAEMVRRGAVHYLVKPVQMSRLWAVVQEAWAARQARLGDRETPHELTPREREVLALLGEGKTDGKIAEVLTVAKCTVNTHVHHILIKLDVRSRLEAALWWKQHRPD